MRLEKIALWRETGLFTEQADGSRGYLGFVRGAFVGDEISIDAGQLHIPAEAQYEYETLLCFLRSADASFLLNSAAAMTASAQSDCNAIFRMPSVGNALAFVCFRSAVHGILPVLPGTQ